MKKFKIGPSFFLLIVFCLLTKNIVLMFNYLLALFLHEMAHLWVAGRRGYSLKLIKLDVFGLAVDLNEKVDDKDQFAINVAGPVCNLLLCVLCLATYWLIPVSYIYLNTFCFANLILAIFNLLPVYPLDGGKIFRGMIKRDKVYIVLDSIIRYSLAIIFICAFILSCFNLPNLLLLTLSIFFITSKADKTPTMSIFKYRQNKHFDKVIILKVEETETLFNLIKQIKSHHYTIFYVPKLEKYFDEDNIIDLSLKFPLTISLSEIK
ncbi:MAG: site-2 protease family protein [Clostridia bacterium]|nr:site-2 protease family protein [Clostridia bacterium]